MRCKHYRNVILVITESRSPQLVNQKEKTLCKCLHFEIYDVKVKNENHLLKIKFIKIGSWGNFFKKP